MYRFETIDNFVAYTKTGSWVIAPEHMTPESDEDFVILARNKRRAVEELRAVGYRHTTDRSYADGSILTMRGNSPEGRLSFNAGTYYPDQEKHNLIIVDNVETYRRWCVATQVATHMRLYNKADRIMLFSAIESGGTSYKSPEDIKAQLENAAGSAVPTSPLDGFMPL